MKKIFIILIAVMVLLSSVSLAEDLSSMPAERREPVKNWPAAMNPEYADETDDDTVPASSEEQMTLDLPMDAEE